MNANPSVVVALRRLFFVFLITLVMPARAAELRVVDGDTLVLNGESIRLKGISAPEMKDPGGKESRAYLLALARNGTVTCELTGERTHDRSVGFCKAGDVDLNGQMVRDGWAAACPRYSGRYVADEAKAKAGRRGIWATGYELPCYCIQNAQERQDCHSRANR